MNIPDACSINFSIFQGRIYSPIKFQKYFIEFQFYYLLHRPDEKSLLGLWAL